MIVSKDDYAKSKYNLDDKAKRLGNSANIVSGMIAYSDYEPVAITFFWIAFPFDACIIAAKFFHASAARLSHPSVRKNVRLNTRLHIRWPSHHGLSHSQADPLQLWPLFHHTKNRLE